MRALVTGAAGFIGSNLARELSGAGWSVVGVDDFSCGNFENLRDFCGDVVAADLSRDTSWSEKVGKVDAVFHQAALTDTTVSDQKRMMEVNVEAFRSLLEWAADSRVRQVVYASSAAVYGDGAVPMKESGGTKPLNVYAFSKRVMERVADDFSRRHRKTRIAGLRYFNVFGPGEAFKGRAASMIWQLSLQMRAGRRPRIFEFGEQFRDFIYVKDVVRANLLALKSGARGVFNVCTGRKTTFNEIIKHLNSVLGTDFKPEYFKNPYSFYQEATLGDPGAAARGFKFNVQYTVEAAIRDYFGASSVGAAR